MQRLKMMSIAISAVVAIAAVLMPLSDAQAARKERVLYNFQQNGTDAYDPQATLIFDKAGNLYGTTVQGGIYDSDCNGNNTLIGCGAVFELKRSAHGQWSEAVLHSFDWTKNDGGTSYGSLILDNSGNLYGTTNIGGTGGCDNTYTLGCGIVFELTPGAHGQWTENILHNFDNVGTDGLYPYAGLISDKAENLYGTTTGGGSNQSGTVFELVKGSNGQWTEKVLYSFKGGTDGLGPYGGLIFDKAGNLYGTTSYYGAYGGGTVFELVRGSNGQWTEKVLHSFNYNDKDGYDSVAGLTFDKAGNLYGTTQYGGTGQCMGSGRVVGCGTVFELKPGAHGKWTEKVLHSFQANGKDGWYPYAGLILDKAGNLYGTTFWGGAYSSTCNDYGCGTAFELIRGANGRWTEKVLHSFSRLSKVRAGGFEPYGGLIFDKSGNLYGTTGYGGTSGVAAPEEGLGTVFELTP
jgi:hypothetical protein